MPMLNDFTGCCGADIIYSFGCNPHATQSYKINNSKYPPTHELDMDGKKIPITYLDQFKDILNKRKAYYPNRLYTLILNEEMYGANDYAWPRILKEMGFEFVRSWSNSNHDGSINGQAVSKTPHPLYLFVLCTDEKGTYKDHNRLPPKWCEL